MPIGANSYISNNIIIVSVNYWPLKMRWSNIICHLLVRIIYIQPWFTKLLYSEEYSKMLVEESRDFVIYFLTCSGGQSQKQKRKLNM